MSEYGQTIQVISDWAIIIGGAVGLRLAWLRVRALNQQSKAATEQARIADRTHASDLFAKSVDGLRHKNLEVQLGSVYTLRQLARDYPEFMRPALRVLQLTLKRDREVQDQRRSDMVIQEIARTITDLMSERDQG